MISSHGQLNGLISRVTLGVVTVNLTVVDVETVGSQDVRLRHFHLVDGIAFVSLCLNLDNIVFHRLDGFALLLCGDITQGYGSMAVFLDAHRALLTRWRIVDGHVAVVDGQVQHIFVMDSFPVCGYQQAEVVEHRTLIATLLRLILTF